MELNETSVPFPILKTFEQNLEFLQLDHNVLVEVDKTTTPAATFLMKNKDYHLFLLPADADKPLDDDRLVKLQFSKFYMTDLETYKIPAYYINNEKIDRRRYDKLQHMNLSSHTRVVEVEEKLTSRLYWNFDLFINDGILVMPNIDKQVAYSSIISKSGCLYGRFFYGLFECTSYQLFFCFPNIASENLPELISYSKTIAEEYHNKKSDELNPDLIQEYIGMINKYVSSSEYHTIINHVE